MNKETRNEREEELYYRLKANAEEFIAKIENKDDFIDIGDLIDSLGENVNNIKFNLMRLEEYVDSTEEVL